MSTLDHVAADVAVQLGVGARPLPPSLRSTLPGSSYVDPSVFDAECERIFEAMWVCVARVDDLDRPGSFVTADVGRESVVVVRGHDHELRAFLNVCRHRGARVCLDEAGQVPKHLRCPYHAWTYDLTGALAIAPNMSSMPDVDRGQLGLHPVALTEWLGYAWVSLAEVPPPFDDVIGDVTARLGDPAVIGRYGLDSLQVGRRVSYEVAANWKLIVENFMECYHCASIHPELVDVLPEFADGYAAQYYVGHGAEFGDDVEGFTVDGGPGLAPLPGLTDVDDRRYFAITVRPLTFVNLVPDHVIFHRMFPLAADRTRVVCDWLFDPAAIDGEADLEPSVELFARVNEQDFAACERTQFGMSSRAYSSGGVLVPSEHHIEEFQRWVGERLA